MNLFSDLTSEEVRVLKKFFQTLNEHDYGDLVKTTGLSDHELLTLKFLLRDKIK